jgi:hypothetical protein
MALAALAAAVPFLLGGNAVVVAWSAFGAALVHAAARKGSVATAAVGLTTIGCSLVAALNERAALHGDFTPFLNAEFLSAVAPAAALALAWRSIERGAEQLRTASVPLLIASTFVGSALLVAEAVRARGLDNASAAFRETALACCAVVAAVFAATVALLSRRRELEVRAAAWAPLAASMLFGIWMLAYGHLEEFTPAVNAPFGAGLVVAAALFLAGALGTLGPVPGVAAVGYLFFLITAEIWAWGRFPHAGLAHDEVRFRVQVGLSVAWTVYAAALVAVGFWRDRALLRWSGIALFLVTAAKVFLVDLDRLETAYRVGSFLVLGILLVAVSYLYQRARRTTGPTTPAVPPATPDPPEPPAA